MAKHRYIAYGYHLKDGEIHINNTEAGIINMIFDLYLEGNSYLTISQILNNENIQYSEAAIWNKNNVGRILKNNKYAEGDKNTAIITAEKFNMAQSIAISNSKIKHKVFSENECLIRELVYCSNCQSRLNSRYGKWVCTKCDNPAFIAHKDINSKLAKILTRLAENNNLIDIPDFISYSPDIEVKRLENELNRQFDSSDSEKNEAITSIFKLADMRYRLCDDGSNGRNGMKIKEYLQKHHVSGKLDIELIKNIAEKIIVQSDGDFYILLKNGQKIK